MRFVLYTTDAQALINIAFYNIRQNAKIEVLKKA